MKAHPLFVLSQIAALMLAPGALRGVRAGQAAPLKAAAVRTAADAPAAETGVKTLRGVTLDGETIDVAAQKGWKVVYFWSGTCPCVSACEHWTFQPLAKRYEGQVRFYAVVSGRFDLDIPRAQLRRQIRAHGLSFPILLDPKHEIVQTLSAMVTPQAFLLDPQNHVLFSGMPDDSRRYLYRTGKSGVTQSFLGQALAEALAGKPVTRPQVKDEGCIIAY